jgi:hypothetical protein
MRAGFMLKKLYTIFLLLVISFMFFSCDSKKKPSKFNKKNIKAEYILRTHDSCFSPNFKITPRTRDLYPWEEGLIGNVPKITKEFFRCKGSSLNPILYDNTDIEKKVTYEDCEGWAKHSMPIINGKENVYPILIEILNYIQYQTKKRVIITCGHRCPVHNKYSDITKQNRISKHMIGAEVDFYVQGLESDPDKVLDLIIQFYREKKEYIGKREYELFDRYEKTDTNTSTKPWFNKEIFIKLFKENEGRDSDNRHPYPYIAIQVRYDKDKGERVVYSWDKATSGYLRW